LHLLDDTECVDCCSQLEQRRRLLVCYALKLTLQIDHLRGSVSGARYGTAERSEHAARDLRAGRPFGNSARRRAVVAQANSVAQSARKCLTL
jgi:hypothetical protein